MEQGKAQTARPDNQLFHDAFRASPIGIALEDLEGRPLYVNPALCSMLGFSEEEMCGKHCVEFSPAEDAEKDWALFQQLRAGSIDHYQIEKRFLRRDGSLIWGRLSISLSNSRASPLVVAMVEDVTEKKMTEDALASLSGRLIEAEEEERKRIAREIHDDYQQRLALVADDLEQLAENYPVDLGAPLRELWNRIHELGGDLHSLSHRLHSSTLERLGLIAGVKAFCEEFSGQQGVDVDFVHQNVPGGIPADAALGLFRVVQEGLRNVKKHSGAERAEVRLELLSERIHLCISDRGKGFDPNGGSTRRGIGIQSMEERLRLLGGKIEIHSQPMKGTRISAWLPLNAVTQRASQSS